MSWETGATLRCIRNTGHTVELNTRVHSITGAHIYKICLKWKHTSLLGLTSPQTWVATFLGTYQSVSSWRCCYFVLQTWSLNTLGPFPQALFWDQITKIALLVSVWALGACLSSLTCNITWIVPQCGFLEHIFVAIICLGWFSVEVVYICLWFKFSIYLLIETK